MPDDTKPYLFPTETLPGLDMSAHLADLVEVKTFLESRGIQTKNTRISRYAEYLEEAIDEVPKVASSIFKHSVDGPFESDTDWFLYVLREVHELMWILKGLKVHVPLGIDDKLNMIVSGSDFAALDTNSQSRNIQFELRIASYFCQTGFSVDLSSETDIIALSEAHALFIECKRVGNFKQLHRRLTEAKKQLHARMPQRYQGKAVFGCIAADVTKVAFAHNGLTFGMTDDHSRDVIQEKLVEISNDTNWMPLFKGCKSLVQYWLQIHIPSAITYPPSTVTRFSSYFVFNERQNRKTRKATREFHQMFDVCSKNADERAVPPEKLTRRRSVKVPKGATYDFDEEILNEYLSKGGPITDRKPQDIVGGLEMHGEDYTFCLQEFQMLISTIPDSQRRTMAENVDHARFELLMEMYIQRYPYEENELDQHEPEGQNM